MRTKVDGSCAQWKQICVHASCRSSPANTQRRVVCELHWSGSEGGCECVRLATRVLEIFRERQPNNGAWVMVLWGWCTKILPRFISYITIIFGFRLSEYFCQLCFSEALVNLHINGSAIINVGSKHHHHHHHRWQTGRQRIHAR